jgi:CBS-domain-containing membrane protein
MLVDPRFRSRSRQALFQAALAAGTLALVLIFEDALANAAIVTAIAASTFRAFVNPGADMAQPRRMIGGHFVAIIVAFVFSIVIYDVSGGSISGHAVFKDIFAASAVGTAIVVMAVTNTEHAPAAGTVLGLVLQPWSAGAAAAVLAAAVCITITRLILRRHLVDLI